MAKLACTCGYIIVDQTDCLPYKGDIIPDKAYFDFLESIGAVIKLLYKANTIEEKQRWIKSHIECDPIPTILEDEHIISLITRSYIQVARTVYQCESCGRIWIGKGNSGEFVPFKPEDSRWKNILAE
jgi:hypothetical protein